MYRGSTLPSKEYYNLFLIRLCTTGETVGKVNERVTKLAIKLVHNLIIRKPNIEYWFVASQVKTNYMQDVGE
jgi:hypothetical protein